MKPPLVTPVNPDVAAAMVYPESARSIRTSVNVAVPCAASPPGFAASASVTRPLKTVTTPPLESTAETCRRIGAPAVAFAGCVTNIRWVAFPRLGGPLSTSVPTLQAPEATTTASARLGNWMSRWRVFMSPRRVQSADQRVKGKPASWCGSVVAPGMQRDRRVSRGFASRPDANQGCDDPAGDDE